jgi:hypothetical protein
VICGREGTFASHSAARGSLNMVIRARVDGARVAPAMPISAREAMSTARAAYLVLSDVRPGDDPAGAHRAFGRARATGSWALSGYCPPAAAVQIIED